MAAESKTSVKSYFETGDKPTQAQFGILIDSYQDFSQELTALTSAIAAGTAPFIAKWESASAASAVAIGAVGEFIVNAGTTASAQDTLGITVGTSAQAKAGTDTTGRLWSAENLHLAATNAINVDRNRLINADGEINQETDISTADDAWGGPDCWYSLTQTGAITASQGTNGEDGMPFFSRINQDQAGAQRMGRAQIIETANCRDLRGQDVVLSGRIRCSASQAIRYTILEHTGTADTVTSDVVNDWTSGTYTTGNFFIAANTTVVGVGSITPSANTWTDITELTGTVSSSMNNLIVFIWTEGTAAQNVTLDFRLQLELGDKAGAVERVDYIAKLQQCQRYFWKTFPLSIAPADNAGFDGALGTVATSNGQFMLETPCPVLMRASPTITTYNPAAGTSGQARNATDNTDTAANDTGISNERYISLDSSIDATDANDRMFIHLTADARL